MPTIKRKVEMNLPQLIEWIIENDTTYEQYEPMLVKGLRFVAVDGYGDIRIHGFVRQDDTFTVEVEEKITEDTVIPKLMTTFKKNYLKGDFGYQRVRIDENYPIKLMLNRAEEHKEPIETLHVVNENGTHTLLWRDGKLVE